MSDLAAYEWRVGGHGNCGIFAMTGYDRDVDAAIGLMNTAELAAAVVEEHNAAIRQGPQVKRERDEARAQLAAISEAARAANDAMRLHNRGGMQWLELDATFAALERALSLAPNQDAEEVEPMLG